VRRRLDVLLESLAITDAPAGFASADAAVLLTIADAIRHHRPVAFRYADRHGHASERTLHAYGLVAHSGRWYVTGVDPGHGGDRTFRLDRISTARTLPGSFDAPGDIDPVRRVVSGFAAADYRYDVRLRIFGTVEQIRAHLPVTVATVDAADDPADADAERWWDVGIRAERLEWLPPVLAALDRPFEVRQPGELRELVLGLAARLAESARRGVVPGSD
jgi:predicted DNA-binding transcriptional regulator YafY